MGVPGAPPPGARRRSRAQTQRAYFRPDIEGLRAVAVMAVLLFHIGLPIAGGGYVGVDVFYVISGFLITGLLLREGETDGKVDLIRFYARRMRRLLPAALLVIVATLAASAVIVSPLRLTEIAGDAAASALYVANFRFAFEATDYLALEAPSPLLHYWSLGVEEQFYLLWPLILLAATRILPRRLIGLFLVVLARRLVRPLVLPDRRVTGVGLLLACQHGPGSWRPAPSWPSACCASPRACRARSTCWRSSAGLALIVAGVVILGVRDALPRRRGAAAGGRCHAGHHGRPARADAAGQAVAGQPRLALPRAHLVLAVPVALAAAHPRAHRPGERRAASCASASPAWPSCWPPSRTELVEQPFRRSGGLARRSRGSVQLGLTASVAVGVGALLMSGAISLPANLLPQDPVVVELAGVREDLPQQLRRRLPPARTRCPSRATTASTVIPRASRPPSSSATRTRPSGCPRSMPMPRARAGAWRCTRSRPAAWPTCRCGSDGCAASTTSASTGARHC